MNIYELCDAFIEHKITIGYTYSYGKIVIHALKKFIHERYPDKEILDKEIGEAWIASITNNSPNTSIRKISIIRELGLYSSRIGISSYILPVNVAPKAITYIPHVFTEAELDAFFKATDAIPAGVSPYRHLIIPIIFRFIYTCGLRPGEATRLQTEHVNLEEGRVFIQKSKGHKDRNVILSDQVIALMKQFDMSMKQKLPSRTYFFAKDKETGYTTTWLNDMFWKCWENAGITVFHGNRPRVMDFRHTFATTRLLLWMEEEVDFDVFMPYLSAYMGHSSIRETAYYFHLIPSFYSKSKAVDKIESKDLIPEVSVYEY